MITVSFIYCSESEKLENSLNKSISEESSSQESLGKILDSFSSENQFKEKNDLTIEKIEKKEEKSKKAKNNNNSRKNNNNPREIDEKYEKIFSLEISKNLKYVLNFLMQFNKEQKTLKQCSQVEKIDNKKIPEKESVIKSKSKKSSEKKIIKGLPLEEIFFEVPREDDKFSNTFFRKKIKTDIKQNFKPENQNSNSSNVLKNENSMDRQ